MARIVELVGKLPGDNDDKDGNDNGDRKENEYISKEVENDDEASPQLCLLKLLSETDMKKISLGREGLLEKLMLCAAMGRRHRDVTARQISKVCCGC